MGWLGWLRGKPKAAADPRITEWQTAWHTALAAPDRAQADALRAHLDGLGLPEEDIEIEREMLDGLEQLAELVQASRTGGLPTLVTGHRVVGADVCHFIAPASIPDDPAQPTGRLILTSTRAIFVGGARGLTLRWHALAEPIHAERDLVLVRTDGQSLHRFRCNSFADAMSAAFIARQLTAAGSRRVVPRRDT
jgi:hypothetical protein